MFPIRNFTNIRPVGAALIHADRRTDMTKGRGTCRAYVKASEINGQNYTVRSVTVGTSARLVLGRASHGVIWVGHVASNGEMVPKYTLFANS
jgi:hypothetical protein